jgi:hypothetical protein
VRRTIPKKDALFGAKGEFPGVVWSKMCSASATEDHEPFIIWLSNKEFSVWSRELDDTGGNPIDEIRCGRKCFIPKF